MEKLCFNYGIRESEGAVNLFRGGAAAAVATSEMGTVPAMVRNFGIAGRILRVG